MASNKELLSGNDNLADEVLIKRELNEYCNIDFLKFIKQYNIPMALNKLNDLRYDMSPSETCLNKRTF